MHDLGPKTDRRKPDGSKLEVLCGVEALSAQRWVAGAISLCANSFSRKAVRRGRVASKIKEFADPEAVSARTLKGEGQDADDQPADRKSAHGAEVAQEGARARSEERRVGKEC